MSDTKYNIIISEGCTAFYTEVNGKTIGGEHEPTRMTDDEIDEFIDYLLVKVKEGIKNQEISIDSLIRAFQYDDWESDDEPCEQCFDTVHRTIWNI